MKTQTISNIEFQKEELIRLLHKAESRQDRSRETVEAGQDDSVTVCLECFLKRVGGSYEQAEEASLQRGHRTHTFK